MRIKNIFTLFILIPFINACTTDSTKQPIKDVIIHQNTIKETKEVLKEVAKEIKKTPFVIKPFKIVNTSYNEAEKFLFEKGIKENIIDIKDIPNVKAKVKKTLTSSFYNTMGLTKIKSHNNEYTNCTFTSSANYSTKFHTFILGFEDISAWYESFLVTYSPDGNLIDFLLIKQGDYIESFTQLESEITKDLISRTMDKANFDKNLDYEVWKEDKFTIDENGNFKGKDLIYPKVENNISATLFEGNWEKTDKSNPISPTKISIEKTNDTGYNIDFGQGANFVKANPNSPTISGKNASGKFTIKLVSEKPLKLLYSDDGMDGHFAPIVDMEFVKSSK